jgi:hypothetical protein
MQRTGVSAVTAYSAHREWAMRPSDERFASVSAQYEAARVRRARTGERTIETHQVRTAAETDDDLVVREASGHTAPLTHWSFEQLAAIAGAPPKYLRTLPAPIASSAINVGLERQQREGHQLFADREAPWTVHAITSPRYARVHHDELAARVLDLMADHSAWQLPLGYKDPVYGAELVPSGAYLGDRDMFLFLVDGNRDLEDPTDQSHGGLFRGFIPEQRRRSRRPHPGCVPLPRGVRQQHHLGLSARRRLSTPARGRVDTRGVDGFAGVRTHGARREPRRRSGHAPASDSPGAGPTREEVLDTVTTRLELSRNQATDAYGLAEQFETNPRSIWGYVQGLTRLSQRTPWQDHRFALDRAASRLLTTVH